MRNDSVNLTSELYVSSLKQIVSTKKPVFSPKITYRQGTTNKPMSFNSEKAGCFFSAGLEMQKIIGFLL